MHIFGEGFKLRRYCVEVMSTTHDVDLFWSIGEGCFVNFLEKTYVICYSLVSLLLTIIIYNI